MDLTGANLVIDTAAAQASAPLLWGTAPNSPWRALVTAQVGQKLTAGSKAPRPKTVRVVAGATRAGLVGFIIQPATVWQILEHVGEPTIAAAIAPARSPPLELNGQQLATPEAALEAIPEIEFDQTANLAAEAGHDLWTNPARADAEPVPVLEFDQTLGL